MPTTARHVPARWALLLAVLLVPGLVADGTAVTAGRCPASRWSRSRARIGPGQGNIVFGMVGRVSGVNYSAAGLRIRYRYQGRAYSVIAWSAAVACVAKVFRPRPACPDIQDQVQAKVEQMAAGSS
jgi:hypothetical protein